LDIIIIRRRIINKIEFRSGKQLVLLNYSDVEIAKLYLDSGVNKMEVINEFRNSGFSTEMAVNIVNCAMLQK
jgi:hypothetical protein